MRSLVGTRALLAFAATAMAAGASASDAKQVHGLGCIQAGVEASCLVVQDRTSGNLYNLLIQGARPAVGTGVEFTGLPFSGATTCRQGIAVQVSSWTPNDTLKCPKGKQKSVQ